MLSRFLRDLLFTIIHFVVDVLVAVQNLYHFYTRKCLERNVTERNCKDRDIRMVLEHMPRLSKSPKHLVFLADTEHHTVSNLAQVVIWGLLAGIPYVSFYDITGELKENEEKLFMEVEKCKIGIPGCIKWTKRPNLNGYTNGIQSHTVNVNIFTSSDGKSRITECIKYIADKKISVSCKDGQLSAEELDKALSLVYPSIPEPDLLLYTGVLCCTYGLLPWQIRLTEFVQVSMDHYVYIDSFIGALYKYSKCDQRFGK